MIRLELLIRKSYVHPQIRNFLPVFDKIVRILIRILNAS
jgi:hypothetical protein